VLVNTWLPRGLSASFGAVSMLCSALLIRGSKKNCSKNGLNLFDLNLPATFAQTPALFILTYFARKR
jgi:hypothetical protein